MVRASVFIGFYINFNQGKVEIRGKKPLKTDIEPASCEQMQTVFILCRQSFAPASCERGLRHRLCLHM